MAVGILPLSTCQSEAADRKGDVEGAVAMAIEWQF